LGSATLAVVGTDVGAAASVDGVAGGIGVDDGVAGGGAACAICVAVGVFWGSVAGPLHADRTRTVAYMAARRRYDRIMEVLRSTGDVDLTRRRRPCLLIQTRRLVKPIFTARHVIAGSL